MDKRSVIGDGQSFFLQESSIEVTDPGFIIRGCRRPVMLFDIIFFQRLPGCIAGHDSAPFGTCERSRFPGIILGVTREQIALARLDITVIRQENQIVSVIFIDRQGRCILHDHVEMIDGNAKASLIWIGKDGCESAGSIHGALVSVGSQLKAAALNDAGCFLLIHFKYHGCFPVSGVRIRLVEERVKADRQHFIRPVSVVILHISDQDPGKILRFPAHRIISRVFRRCVHPAVCRNQDRIEVFLEGGNTIPGK